MRLLCGKVWALDLVMNYTPLSFTDFIPLRARGLDALLTIRGIEMKLFYVAVMALLLGGCASTNTKEDPDICRHASESIRKKFNRTTSIDKEVVNVETSEKMEFYELTPIKVFSGIESANLNNVYLTLKITDKALFEQYSAPIINSMLQAQYEAHPFTGTFTPIGIFVWLFNPTDMNAFTFGCTEITLMSSDPDATKKVKTGKSEWKDIQKSHRILVSGFDKDYEFVLDDKGREKPSEIDLSSAISNTELTKNTTLKITCLDCDLLGSEEQNLYKDRKINVVLTHDFSPIKESLAESKKVRYAEEERIKIVQVKRDKEESKLRELQAKEDLKAERQKQGVPLDGFKAQCKELGFKVGSTDFGNCVLQLNDTK